MQFIYLLCYGKELFLSRLIVVGLPLQSNFTTFEAPRIDLELQNIYRLGADDSPERAGSSVSHGHMRPVHNQEQMMLQKIFSICNKLQKLANKFATGFRLCKTLVYKVSIIAENMDRVTIVYIPYNTLKIKIFICLRPVFTMYKE